MVGVCARLFLAGAAEPDEEWGEEDEEEPGEGEAAVSDLGNLSEEPNAPAPLPRRVIPLPRLTAVDPETRSVECEGGRRVPNVDRILFATGYLYTLPFLSSSSSSCMSRSSLAGLARTSPPARLLSWATPSLALLALQQRVIPFPLAEAQACVLARAWAGRLAVPPPGRETGDREEEDRRVLVLGHPLDSEYIAYLLRWAASADPGVDGAGKSAPPGWGPREVWMREKLPGIRSAFASRGAHRFDVRTVEELGFVFEDGDGEYPARRTQGLNAIHFAH
jgi:hypothetical protein